MRDVDNHQYWVDEVRRSKTIIDKVPSEFHGDALYLAAVNAAGAQLKRVPEEKRNRVVCEAAVRQYPLALEYVPLPLRDGPMCDLALRGGTGWVLYHIPESLRTEKRCLKAVKEDGTAIGYVPASIMSLELAQTAYRQDPKALTLLVNYPALKKIIVCEAAIGLLKAVRKADEGSEAIAAGARVNAMIESGLLTKAQKELLGKMLTALSKGENVKVDSLTKDGIRKFTVERDSAIEALNKKAAPQKVEQIKAPARKKDNETPHP